MKNYALLAAMLAPMAAQAADTIALQMPDFYGQLNLTVQANDDSEGE